MADSDFPTPEGPVVFSAHLSELLQREYDRMAVLTARGEGIARTVLSIATVLVAASTVALTTNADLRLHAATWWFVGAAGLASLSSLGYASLAQSASTMIKATDDETITKMIGKKWDDPHGDPRWIVANRTVEGIRSLRSGNEIRALQARVAFLFQFIFVALLVVALTVEIILT